MNIKKIVKTTLLGMAIVGATLSAGCGGPKAPKDMTFNELITDWNKNIETVATERDKRIEEYIQKDPETYKIFTIKKELDGLTINGGDKELDRLNFSEKQISAAETAMNEIADKTKDKVDRMKEEQELSLKILRKAAYKDQNALWADQTQWEKTRNEFNAKVDGANPHNYNQRKTRFGQIEYNLDRIKYWQEKNKKQTNSLG